MSKIQRCLEENTTHKLFQCFILKKKAARCREFKYAANVDKSVYAPINCQNFCRTAFQFVLKRIQIEQKIAQEKKRKYFEEIMFVSESRK